jgi:hypothetical protein
MLKTNRSSALWSDFRNKIRELIHILQIKFIEIVIPETEGIPRFFPQQSTKFLIPCFLFFQEFRLPEE